MKQLKLFLGSINHQAKFIPNAANLTDKLRPLLREENQNKRLKKREIGTEKLRMGLRTLFVFETIKNAVAFISKVH